MLLYLSRLDVLLLQFLLKSTVWITCFLSSITLASRIICRRCVWMMVVSLILLQS